ncbi:MAG: hypothetical protein Q7S92_00900 [Candidatus Diapherotrites archaeon]|nr:hypothetical protein [Candidatus Diapherotrites archaeon]
MPIRKRPSVFNLRRLGSVLQEKELGLALRGTNAKEPRTRKPKIVNREGGTLYYWVRPRNIDDNRQFLRELRTTIFAAVNHATGAARRLEHWKYWKTKEDRPAIVILGDRETGQAQVEFIGGYGNAYSNEYRRRMKPLTPGFPKEHMLEIEKKHVLAVISPTQKDMEKVEQLAGKRNVSLEDAFKEWVVSKVSRKLAQIFEKDLKK